MPRMGCPVAKCPPSNSKGGSNGLVPITCAQRLDWRHDADTNLTATEPLNQPLHPLRCWPMFSRQFFFVFILRAGGASKSLPRDASSRYLTRRQLARSFLLFLRLHVFIQHFRKFRFSERFTNACHEAIF